MLYKYSLIYIYFILSSKNMVPLFCFQFRGRYSGKFTHSTSVFCSSYRKNLHIQIFLKLAVIVLWTRFFHKTNLKMGVNHLVSKLGAPHYQHFIQNSSILQEVGEAIEKISTFRFFLNLLNLFLGPYKLIKQSKNGGSIVLFSS